MVIESAGSAPPRPGLLTGGFGVTIASAVTGATATVFWLLMYRSAAESLPRTPSGREALAGLDVLFYFLIAISFTLAIGLGAGAVAMWLGSNVGRILIWSFGGVSIAWHMCCGLYTAFVSSAMTAYDRSGAPIPYWQVDLATIFGFLSGVLSIVGIILIAQSSVNIYFRRLSGRGHRRPRGQYPQYPGTGVYEPFGGAEPAPSTHWPNPSDQSVRPGRSSSAAAWSDPTQPDETVWQRPGDNGGDDDQTFQPPR